MCEFSNHASNKFVLLLQKGIYLYEYMDDQEEFNQTLLPEKEDFSNHLNMKHINALTKKVCKDFEIEKIRRIS